MVLRLTTLHPANLGQNSPAKQLMRQDQIREDEICQELYFVVGPTPGARSTWIDTKQNGTWQRDMATGKNENEFTSSHSHPLFMFK